MRLVTVAAVVLLFVLASLVEEASAFVIPNSFAGRRLHSASVSRHGLFAVSVGYNSTIPQKSHRFERTATDVAKADQPCIFTIHGVRYNVTAWAKAHPGGVNVLHKFHGKDATKAFAAADHSKMAHEMLRQFAIAEDSTINVAPTNDTAFDTTSRNIIETLEATSPSSIAVFEQTKSRRPRWVQKLFTKEDPIGVHKTMGVFVLLHFLYRYGQMYFGDPSAGFGTRMGKGPGLIAPLCLIPHAVLSLSSLIFHTVPRERVVGKPMIWQEYRVHNIAFGLRSVITAFLSWLTIYKGNTAGWRRLAVVGCCVTALTANIVADEGTRRLRAETTESTTATMPYWDGCSRETQKKFKTFYAYCQFLATGACITVGNPAWPLSVLLAIQLASLLMTLVRKGLLSAKGYHIGYTITLIMPYFVAMRSMMYSKSLDFPIMAAMGWMLYQLRCRGVNKYVLWLPLYAFRIAYGDRFLNWQVW